MGHVGSKTRLLGQMMCHIGSKTRLLDQMLEKPCACSRGHIFSPIIMKLGQIDCLDKISDMFKNGSCRVKTRSLAQNLEKPCVRCRGHIFSLIIVKPCPNVCHD